MSKGKIIVLEDNLDPVVLKENTLVIPELNFEEAFVSDNFDSLGYNVNHLNYLTYLETCYANHYGIVVAPHYFWYTILCEVASQVKESPERFRSVFSRSKEKVEITTSTSSVEFINLDAVINSLKEHVPLDVDMFFPTFSTSTLLYETAIYATFCDTVSPYYDYMTFLCGIPKVRVEGTVEDWTILITSLKKINNILNIKYLSRMEEYGQTILNNLNNGAFWRDIFRLVKCGSGSQVEVSGWFTRIFLKKPLLRFTYNYPTHVSKVDYQNLETERKFNMRLGLFGSKIEDGFLIPEYGYIIHEKVEL